MFHPQSFHCVAKYYPWCEVRTEVDRVSVEHEVRVFTRSRITRHPAHHTLIKVVNASPPRTHSYLIRARISH